MYRPQTENDTKMQLFQFLINAMLKEMPNSNEEEIVGNGSYILDIFVVFLQPN